MGAQSAANISMGIGNLAILSEILYWSLNPNVMDKIPNINRTTNITTKQIIVWINTAFGSPGNPTEAKVVRRSLFQRKNNASEIRASCIAADPRYTRRSFNGEQKFKSEK
jgi:hypothetical protein